MDTYIPTYKNQNVACFIMNDLFVNHTYKCPDMDIQSINDIPG